MNINGQLKNLQVVAWRLHQIQEALRICGQLSLADKLNDLSHNITVNVDYIEKAKPKGVR